MKKNLINTIGIIGAVSLLAGCVPGQNIQNTGIFANGGKEVFNLKEYNSPAKLSKETVELTKNVKGNKVEVTQITEEQNGCLSDAALNLLSEISSKENGENVLISPFSISAALGMTENGAEGDTLSQMEETVNGGLTLGEMNSIMYKLSEEMNSSDEVDWNVANSIWFKDDGEWKINDAFLNEVVTYYHPELFKAPFDNQTVVDINAWVKHETHDMIPEVLDYIPDEARMYLINAIAFEGEWLEEYEEDAVKEGMQFTNSDGSTSDVTMLCSEEGRYFTLGNGKGFVKPYKGDRYSFVGILPEEGVSPEEYIAGLVSSGEDFSKAVREAKSDSVAVRIPEFTLDYDIELSETYKGMGMDKPFKGGEAEFYKMMQPEYKEAYEIWIGRILHKTHIEVDRKGTKAAAVTVVEMDCGCEAEIEPREIHTVFLDRPFVYAIVDNATGLPVFIGCQNTME